MNKFEALIRNALKNRKMNQRQLADAVGVTPTQISRVLTGDRGASEKLLKKMSSILLVPMEDIYESLDRISANAKPDPRREKINLILDQLSDDDEEKFLSFLETFLDNQDEKKRDKGKKK